MARQNLVGTGIVRPMNDGMVDVVIFSLLLSSSRLIVVPSSCLYVLVEEDGLAR